MSSYMDKKKTHKLGRIFSIFFGWQVRPLCKVDNKTWAYKKSTVWVNVTCSKCLEYKK